MSAGFLVVVGVAVRLSTPANAETCRCAVVLYVASHQTSSAFDTRRNAPPRKRFPQRVRFSPLFSNLVVLGVTQRQPSKNKSQWRRPNGRSAFNTNDRSTARTLIKQAF